MSRGGVGDELRRALGRIGGAPAVHRPPAPPARTHALTAPVARPVTVAPPGPRPGARALTGGLDPLRVRAAPSLAGCAGARRAVVAPPHVHARGLRGAATARRLPVGRVATPAHALRTVVAPAVAAVGVPRWRPRQHDVALPRVRRRTVAPLPRAATARRVPLLAAARVVRPATPPAALFVRWVARVPWTELGAARLGGGWARLLAEHRVPAAELRLLGVWGPLPLARVGAAAPAPDGRLAVRLRRGPAAPRGDVLLARHELTGRLLRTDHPAAAGPATAAPRAAVPRLH